MLTVLHSTACLRKGGFASVHRPDAEGKDSHGKEESPLLNVNLEG